MLESTEQQQNHEHKSCNRIPTILFFARQMKNLAEEIKSCSSEHHIKLGHIKWDTFADSWPNIFIDDSEKIRNSNVLFLASFQDPQTIFEQISVLYHLPKYLCRSLKVLLPYFPTGTMERIQIQGEIATAYSLAQMLSSIPLTRTGPCEVVILDIHSLQNQFYFSSNILIRLESTVRLLVKELKKADHSNKKYAVAFPDDGAHKRFSDLLRGYDYPTVVCNKTREGTKRKTAIIQGSPTDFHCIIIDDLVQTGGTIIECAQTLLSNGAAHVSAFIGHGIFPNESWKKFLHDNKPVVHFEKFYVTNTYPNTQILIDKPPFKVLSIAELLRDICFE